MYDLIGDIHGYADELVQLLQTLGYTERSGVFQHPTRRVIFCGDFIDRGPQIRDVLTIARNMVDSGMARAVMGNHEFNAIAFHTERPDAPGQHFRRHSERNIHQHQATLQQLAPAEMRSALDWFATLPVALDLGNVRVVHACWDPPRIQLLERSLQQFGQVSPEFLRHATDAAHELFTAVERVLKGPELRLPEGVVVRDKEGSERRQIRIRWYEEPTEHSYASYALPAVDHPELLELPVQYSHGAVPYARHEPPVFVGHYWMPDAVPRPLASNIACLDYSVAKDGHLCAYRFDGEPELSADRFVTIPSRTRR